MWSIVFGSLPYIALLSDTSFKATYAIWVFALFFILPGYIVLMPSATIQFFGAKHMASIFGTILCASVRILLFLTEFIFSSAFAFLACLPSFHNTISPTTLKRSFGLARLFVLPVSLIEMLLYRKFFIDYYYYLFF